MTAKQPIHLYVGTPCYGGQVTTAYFTSLLNLQETCAQGGIDLTVLTLWGDALITRARQNIVARFLEDPTATHLLFIDADIGFEPAQVFRLLAFNKEITAALYPLKKIHWKRVQELALNRSENLESAALSYVVEWKSQYTSVNGFAKVAYAGTGFLLIRREVFLALMKHYPQLRYKGGNQAEDPLSESQYCYAFFNCLLDETTSQYLPEDFSFCKLWTDMGGEIWGDFQSRLDHVGPMVFKGNVALTCRPASENAKTQTPGAGR
jgi:hypothetical protein